MFEWRAVNGDGKLEFFEFCDIIAKNRKTVDQEEDECGDTWRLVATRRRTN